MQNRDAGRVGVLIVAYNAAKTLASVLDRLPTSFRQAVDHVVICDDASQDDTYGIGVAYQATTDLPLTVIRHPRNLGYGGNQKAGYRWAIDRGLDVVVLLHGDGQYAPEVIEDLVEPLLDGRADAVFGSRMMIKGAARRGGMPTYKFVGNRVLTRFENACARLELSEWHSGYRAYRVDALGDIAFEANSNGFDFDTEIILQLHEAGKKLLEVPIPTYYGDEICHVNGLAYARDVARHALRHRLQRAGLGTGPSGSEEPYDLKLSPRSSHGRLLAWMRERPPGRVLDVGCSDGQLGSIMRTYGHHVTGVDAIKHDHVGEHLDGFCEADLNRGLPDEVGTGYDTIVAADVLEHTAEPSDLLAEMAGRLAPDGSILVSVPNFVHWYPRARVALGRFDYDHRGILDRGHLRFFTRHSFERMTRSVGLSTRRHAVVGTPIEVLQRGGGDRSERLFSALGSADHRAAQLWPSMFGYQFVFELRSA